MPFAALSILAPLLALLAWLRFSTFAVLSRLYPLSDEWPDRSYSGVMIAADALIYRVTVGANGRGLTFHSFLFRLLRVPTFIPWSDVSVAEGPHSYFGTVARLSFSRAPRLEVAVHGGTWRNILFGAGASAESAITTISVRGA